MEMITQRVKLIDRHPERAAALAAERGVKAEDIAFLTKGYIAEKIELAEGERAVVGYISSEAMDRDREVVRLSGADLKHYKQNPVVLYGHDYYGLPIGKNVGLKVEDGKLVAKTEFASHGLAEDVWGMFKDGMPLAFSIGFISWSGHEPDEKEREEYGDASLRYIHDKWELLEYSVVPVPANPEAVTVAVAKGLRFQTERAAADIRALDKGFELWQVAVDLNTGGEGAPYYVVTRAGEKPEGLAVSMEKGEETEEPGGETIEVEIAGQKYTMPKPAAEEPAGEEPAPEEQKAKEPRELIIEGKGVIPYRAHGECPLAEEAEEWDAAEEREKATIDDLRVMCALVDPEQADERGAYALLHHRADEGYPVAFPGVAAAMMRVLTLGVNVAEAEYKGVYDHLAKHYEQFGIAAPKCSFYDPVTLKCEACGGAGFRDGEPCTACGAWGYNEAGYALYKEVWGKELKPQFTYRAVYQSDTGTGKKKPAAKAPAPPIAPAGEMAEYIAVIKEHNTLLRARLEAEAETKEGRVLSSKNRSTVQKAVAAMKDAAVALEALLEATEPDKSAEAPEEKSEGLIEVDPDFFGKAQAPDALEAPAAKGTPGYYEVNPQELADGIVSALEKMDLSGLMNSAMNRARGRVS